MRECSSLEPVQDCGDDIFEAVRAEGKDLRRKPLHRRESRNESAAASK